MPHDEGHFRTPDGLSLYEQCWLPAGESTAVVLLVHGFTEHSGRYAQVAGELNRQGYAVYAMDLRGHGKSEGDRVFVRTFDDYLADLDQFLGRVRQREPDKPLFLFGHSMGGTIVGLYAARRQPRVNGVVLQCAGRRGRQGGVSDPATDRYLVRPSVSPDARRPHGIVVRFA